ncbi:MAG: hypothetical protein IT379_35280 [Deltaproteobacteria bacterium]|nr:hypothetical protein [Deltaproteobacteria bacterium]
MTWGARSAVGTIAVAAIALLACGDSSSDVPRDANVGMDAPRDPDTGVDATPDMAPTSSGRVGAPCAEDRGCQAGLECFLGPEGARAWPNGYCTRACERDVDCPSGSACGSAWYDEAVGDNKRCLATCERVAGSAGGCREGYNCAFDGVCVVGCSSDAQCEHLDSDIPPPRPDEPRTCELASGRCVHGAQPSAAALTSCGSDADCRGPAGACVGGMCFLAHCDLGGPYACADGEVCIALGALPETDRLAHVCLPRCTPGIDGTNGASADDRCPRGFACWPRELDLDLAATDGFCFLPAAGSFAGSESARVGDACRTVADCPNPYGYGLCLGTCAILFCAAESVASLELCAGEGERCLSGMLESSEPIGVRVLDAAGSCVRDCSSGPDVCAPPSVCGSPIPVCM